MTTFNFKANFIFIFFICLSCTNTSSRNVISKKDDFICFSDSGIFQKSAIKVLEEFQYQVKNFEIFPNKNIIETNWKISDDRSDFNFPSSYEKARSRIILTSIKNIKPDTNNNLNIIESYYRIECERYNKDGWYSIPIPDELAKVKVAFIKELKKEIEKQNKQNK